MPPFDDLTMMGLSLRFVVTIDNGEYNLGSWHKAEGLSVKWTLADHRTGDAGNQRWFFPGSTEYTPVKLTRACTVEGTTQVKKWLDSTSFNSGQQSMKIAMHDAWAKEVHFWELFGIMPTNWSGPQFDAMNSKVATETLEFVHNGFLNDLVETGYSALKTRDAGQNRKAGGGLT